MIDDRVEEILISNEELKKGIKEAANWIDINYTSKEPVLIGLLKGCIPFYGHLITLIKTDFTTDFMVVSSYKGTDKTNGKPEIVTDIYTDINNKDVILIEDIVDSGYTIKFVKEYLYQRNPRSVKVITLLDKKEGRKVEFEADYKCFDVENKFLVGFGLDYQEKCRNLPHICVMRKDKIG
ncbi:MAG: hypoxanthine phosphoribosyltransferase [Mycoplasma sp.]|nr:hypoxanthine phosphoribosyltransferase [Mycoplasma sp.]